MADDYTLKDRISDLGESIAEQFRNIARQLEIIDGKLDEKASLVQLREVEDRFGRVVEKLEGRVIDLERLGFGSTAVSKYQRFLFATIGVVFVAGLVTLVVFAIEAAMKGSP